MNKIAIGLITYNNLESDLDIWKQSLDNAISYARNKGMELSVQVIYIDNGSESKSLDELSYSNKLESRGNIGYTVASNILMDEMMESSDADYYLSANPDGMFHPFFLYEILNFAKEHPLAILESSQFPEEHPKEYSLKTFETAWASGCASLYPRKILEDVGKLDETFFMYCEDVDFSWRTKAKGYNVKHCPSAKYAHFVLNRTISRQTTKYFYESGRYLAEKYKNSDFCTFCESVLIDEKFYNSLDELPENNIEAIDCTGKQLNDIVNFSEKFYFSKGRW